MGSVIKMYGVGTGGAENAVAVIDVPMSGDLIGLQWSFASEVDADQDTAECQLSFRSTGSFATNDDRGIISECRQEHQLTTSGAIVSGINYYCALPDIPVGAGERLYIHLNATASTPSVVSCMLHFTFDIDKVASRRR